MVGWYELLAAATLLYLPTAARIAGLVSVAPVFASGALSPPLRVALVVAVSLALAPLFPATWAQSPLQAGQYLLLVLSELALGLALGLGARLLLEALSFAGQALDLQIGLYAAAFYDPTSGHQTTPTGHLFSLAAVVLFLQLEGHHWLLTGLAGSLHWLPTGEAIVTPHLWPLVTRLGGSIFTLALQVAAPVMITMFLVDLAFGIVSRAVPQMHVFLVGLPAKIAAGIIGLMLCVPLLLSAVDMIVAEMNRFLVGWMHP